MIREVRVAHVELSLSGAFVPQARTPAEAEFVTSIDRWRATVETADIQALTPWLDFAFAATKSAEQKKAA